jgi:hypothetical protein
MSKKQKPENNPKYKFIQKYPRTRPLPQVRTVVYLNLSEQQKKENDLQKKHPILIIMLYQQYLMEIL